MKTTATKVIGDKLKGSRWSKVVQDVWSDVCITATTQQHHWDQVGMKSVVISLSSVVIEVSRV